MRFMNESFVANKFHAANANIMKTILRNQSAVHGPG